jgi:hypothetical protein
VKSRDVTAENRGGYHHFEMHPSLKNTFGILIIVLPIWHIIVHFAESNNPFCKIPVWSRTEYNKLLVIQYQSKQQQIFQSY